MLYPLILVIHVFVCFILVGVILLQAGRGGGLAEAFGGTAQSLFGTRGAAYLTRATTACAVMFMLTSLGLAFLSAQRGRSLMEGVRPAPEEGASSTRDVSADTVPGLRPGTVIEEEQAAPAGQAPAESAAPSAPTPEQPTPESAPSE